MSVEHFGLCGRSILSTFIGMLSTTITFVFAMFILRPIRRHSSDSSCSSCSYCGVNNLDEMVSPCITPLFILIVTLSLCRCTVTELFVCVIQDFYVHIFYSLFMQ